MSGFQCKVMLWSVILSVLCLSAEMRCQEGVLASPPSLIVTSEPPDADITVDGSETGKTTPDTVFGLTLGRHKLELKLDGYRTHSCEFPVTGMMPWRLNVSLKTLKKEAGKTVVKVNPVIVNNQQTSGGSQIPVVIGGDEAINQALFLYNLYPGRALKKNITGYAVVELTVEADGYVYKARVIHEEPLDYDFGAAAAKVVKKLKYSPALDASGRRISRKFRQTIRFDPKYVADPRESRNSRNS